MSEMRCNLITGDWVIIATERALRPHEFQTSLEQKGKLAWSETCPFCPGNEDKTPNETLRLSLDKESWFVRTVPNKFSALAPEGKVFRKSDGLKRMMTGIGLHEVIIESPEHHLTTALLPIKQVERILVAYQNRFQEFYHDPRVEHVIIFKNHGKDAGTSLEHPHSQIVGTPVLPGQIRSRIDDAMHLYDALGECVYCQTIQMELEDKSRIVEENDSFIAFIPYAALSPFHLWLFPRNHSACFGNLTETELKDLALILKKVLLKIYLGLDDPPFNYVVRSISPEEGAAKYFHWYIAIVPRTTNIAGFELGTGMYINTALPEDSAEYLRNVSLENSEFIEN